MHLVHLLESRPQSYLTNHCLCLLGGSNKVCQNSSYSKASSGGAQNKLEQILTKYHTCHNTLVFMY